MLDFTPKNVNMDESINENGFTDILKKAADIDKETEDKWSNSGPMGKLNTINDVTAKNAGNLHTAIDPVLQATYANSKSIIARARNSTMEFPVYISRSIPVNASHLIAKSFERVYASFFQTALAQNPIIDEKDANNLVFLKQFHTNIRESAEKLLNPFYEPIDDWDKMMQESVYTRMQLTDDIVLEFRVVPTENDDLIMEFNHQMHEPLEGFSVLQEADAPNLSVTNKSQNERGHILNRSELQDLLLTVGASRSGNANVTTDDIKTAGMSIEDITKEADVTVGRAPEKPGNRATDEETAAYKKNVDDYNKRRTDEINKLKDAQKKASDKINTAIDNLRRSIRDRKVPGYAIDTAGQVYRIDVSTTTTRAVLPPVDTPTLLKDGDIKKINGMLPYTIEASFRMRSADGTTHDVKYLIGIKTVLHPIRTQDLAEDLRDIVMGNIKSLRKVRYKTGELSFKEYIFNTKGLKKDASKRINYDKRWINTLKRLGDFEKMNGSLLGLPIKAVNSGDVPIPNGTLVLSQPDVTALTNQTGVDLSEINNAKRLAKSLFLIAVVIVDSSAGTMKVLFPDTDVDWDVQSLASIDAEIAKTDNSQLMRELNKVVNR